MGTCTGRPLIRDLQACRPVKRRRGRVGPLGVTPKQRTPSSGITRPTSWFRRDLRRAWPRKQSCSPRPWLWRHLAHVLPGKQLLSAACAIIKTPTPSSGRPDGSPWAVRMGTATLRMDLSNFQHYGEACYLHCRSVEGDFLAADCLARQPVVTPESRSKNISWLTTVHRHLNLGFESLCLAVNIMDRFLCYTIVSLEHVQLLSVTALFLAHKQVGMRFQPVTVKQLLSRCGDSFSPKQLLKMERSILLRLGFRLAAPTLDFYLEHYTNLRVAHEESTEKDCVEAMNARSFATELAEQSLADYGFNKYPPSLLAICCLGLGDQILGHARPLNLHVSGYSDAVIHECTEQFRLLVSRVQPSQLSVTGEMVGGWVRDSEMVGRTGEMVRK